MANLPLAQVLQHNIITFSSKSKESNGIQLLLYFYWLLQPYLIRLGIFEFSLLMLQQILQTARYLDIKILSPSLFSYYLQTISKRVFAYCNKNLVQKLSYSNF